MGGQRGYGCATPAVGRVPPGMPLKLFPPIPGGRAAFVVAALALFMGLGCRTPATWPDGRSASQRRGLSAEEGRAARPEVGTE